MLSKLPDDISLIIIRFKLLLLILVLISLISLARADDAGQCRINTDQNQKTKGSVSINIHPDQILKRAKPELLLGFNVNSLSVQRNLYNNKDNTVNDSAMALLRDLPGISYRYPGGTISNHFNWQWSTGVFEKRSKQKIAKWLEPVKMRFGINEYFRFVDTVNGEPLYVANLVGWDNKAYKIDLNMKIIRSSNIEFAKYLKKKNSPKLNNILIELGNELDRGYHQWSAKHYVQRAKIVASDIKKVLPNSRILIPLREWEWRYRGNEKHREKQRGSEMISKTMAEFPDAYGVSFHVYYHPDTNKYPYWDMRKRLELIDKNILNIIKSGGNKNLKVWITEHSIQRLDQKSTREMRHVSPPMQSALMSGQFISLLFDKPYMEGASLHMLNGGAVNDGRWKILSVNQKNKNVKGMPTYWMLKLLRNVLENETFKIDIKYPLLSYGDTDKLTVLAFSNNVTGKLSLFIVNAGGKSKHVDFGGAFLANKNVALNASVLCDNEIKPVNQKKMTKSFTNNGRMIVIIPKFSISTIELSQIGQ